MASGIHVVSKRLASGVMTHYVYAWRGGPLIHRSEGERKPKITASIQDAAAEAVRCGAPSAALQAVATSFDEAHWRDTVSDVMLDAAAAAGVPMATAADAFGCLIARREIDVDLAAGVVCSDRTLERASGLYPSHIREAWRVSSTAATHRPAFATAWARRIAMIVTSEGYPDENAGS